MRTQLTIAAFHPAGRYRRWSGCPCMWGPLNKGPSACVSRRRQADMPLLPGRAQPDGSPTASTLVTREDPGRRPYRYSVTELRDVPRSTRRSRLARRMPPASPLLLPGRPDVPRYIDTPAGADRAHPDVAGHAIPARRSRPCRREGRHGHRHLPGRLQGSTSFRSLEDQGQHDHGQQKPEHTQRQPCGGQRISRIVQLSPAKNRRDRPAKVPPIQRRSAPITRLVHLSAPASRLNSGGQARIPSRPTWHPQ
jgi:hypothetical protein